MIGTEEASAHSVCLKAIRESSVMRVEVHSATELPGKRSLAAIRRARKVVRVPDEGVRPDVESAYTNLAKPRTTPKNMKLAVLPACEPKVAETSPSAAIQSRYRYTIEPLTPAEFTLVPGTS